MKACGQGSSVGITTGYGLGGPEIESRWGRDFHTCPDRPWGPPSLLYNEYRVFSEGKERPGRDADPSPPSSAVVMKGKSYTSTPPMGRTACTEPQCLYKGSLYLYFYNCIYISNTTGWKVWGSNPDGARFSAIEIDPGAQPASCTKGTGSFPRVKNGQGVTLTPHPLLVPWSWKGTAIPLLQQWSVWPVQSLSACTRVTFTFYRKDYAHTCGW